jgi:hypothetical protein
MGTRYFALAAGIVYLLVGLMGLLGLGLAAPTAGDPGLAIEAQYGRLLGLFPVNVLHNIVHLAIGIWGIVSYRSFNGSRAFARGLAILYALLAIMGLLPFTNTTFGLIPIHSHDVWLHAATAAVAAYFGFAAQPERAEFVDASRRR